MSVLAPLYLLGLAAISLPLVFHLIRRTPRGEMNFSSLMFLQPSPPRLTKRSRLDNLLLLLLRGLALALLAVAFSRPFFRQTALITADEVGVQRVAVLVDASASMRRGDLWQQAVAAVNETLGRLRPQDRFAVYAFDESLRPVASYRNLAELETSRRRAAAAEMLKTVQPTWAGTRLGRCLADALASMEEMQDAQDEDVATPRRIVLVSDLQAGGRLDELAEYDWPADAQLELVPLTPRDSGNAGLELLGSPVAAATAEEARDRRLRARVNNAADSTADAFRVQWQDPAGNALDDPIDVHAPPGESRVARIPLPRKSAATAQLVLAGDAYDFDNAIFYVPPRTETVRVAYFGNDEPDDVQGMAYYLKLALQDNAARAVEIQHIRPDRAAPFGNDPPQLVVIAAPPFDSLASELERYLQEGGTVLYVATGSEDAGPLGDLLGASDLAVSEVEPDDYAMLGQIEFDHPLFAAMAGPQFNNFTQILFWKYRRIDESSLNGVDVLARFDSGDAAILQKRTGAGELLVMAAGWNPGDSQLARSWKFLLMLSSLIDQHSRETAFAPTYQVNQRVPLPPGIELAAKPTVVKPDGNELTLPDGAFITGADQPGVYRLATSDGTAEFAVNLDPAETNTAPLPQEAFEQLGAKMTDAFDATAQREKMQQMRDVELEGRQKVWKWLVAAALAVLIVETYLAGRLTRPAEATPAHA